MPLEWSDLYNLFEAIINFDVVGISMLCLKLVNAISPPPEAIQAMEINAFLKTIPKTSLIFLIMLATLLCFSIIVYSPIIALVYIYRKHFRKTINKDTAVATMKVKENKENNNDKYKSIEEIDNEIYELDRHKPSLIYNIIISFSIIIINDLFADNNKLIILAAMLMNIIFFIQHNNYENKRSKLIEQKELMQSKNKHKHKGELL